MSKSIKPQHPKPLQQRTWLIPVVIVAVVAVVLGIVAALSGSRRDTYQPKVTGMPRAALDQTSIDHGAVPFEQPVESVFRIRNEGDQPLTILKEPRVELLQGC